MDVIVGAGVSGLAYAGFSKNEYIIMLLLPTQFLFNINPPVSLHPTSS